VFASAPSMVCCYACTTGVNCTTSVACGGNFWKVQCQLGSDWARAVLLYSPPSLCTLRKKLVAERALYVS
jgi:hypothetical protein